MAKRGKKRPPTNSPQLARFPYQSGRGDLVTNHPLVDHQNHWDSETELLPEMGWNAMGHGSMVPQKVGQVDQFIEESSLVNIQKTIE